MEAGPGARLQQQKQQSAEAHKSVLTKLRVISILCAVTIVATFLIVAYRKRLRGGPTQDGEIAITMPSNASTVVMGRQVEPTTRKQAELAARTGVIPGPGPWTR